MGTIRNSQNIRAARDLRREDVRDGRALRTGNIIVERRLRTGDVGLDGALENVRAGRNLRALNDN